MTPHSLHTDRSRHAGRVLTAIAVFLVLLASPRLSVAQTQPIGIPRNTRVEQSQQPLSAVPGYCLEKRVLGSPSPGTPVHALCGTVRIEYTDGRLQAGKSFAELLRNEQLRVFCDGRSTTVYFWLHPTIRSIEFESNAAISDLAVNAKAQSATDWQTLVDNLMTKVDPDATERLNQHLIHDNPFPYLEPPSPPRTTILRSHRWDHASFMSLRFPMLHAQVDSSIMMPPTVLSSFTTWAERWPSRRTFSLASR
jgi:hypothetical protein